MAGKTLKQRLIDLCAKEGLSLKWEGDGFYVDCPDGYIFMPLGSHCLAQFLNDDETLNFLYQDAINRIGMYPKEPCYKMPNCDICNNL